jgi:hypothetical protein
MGRALGKGGFAICHEGESEGEQFALKIVKSHMSQDKMKQKVSPYCFNLSCSSMLIIP